MQVEALHTLLAFVKKQNEGIKTTAGERLELNQKELTSTTSLWEILLSEFNQMGNSPLARTHTIYLSIDSSWEDGKGLDITEFEKEAEWCLGDIPIRLAKVCRGEKTDTWEAHFHDVVTYEATHSVIANIVSRLSKRKAARVSILHSKHEAPMTLMNFYGQVSAGTEEQAHSHYSSLLQQAAVPETVSNATYWRQEDGKLYFFIHLPDLDSITRLISAIENTDTASIAHTAPPFLKWCVRCNKQDHGMMECLPQMAQKECDLCPRIFPAWPAHEVEGWDMEVNNDCIVRTLLRGYYQEVWTRATFYCHREGGIFDKGLSGMLFRRQHATAKDSNPLPGAATEVTP